MTHTAKASLWHRISGPTKIGVAFGLVGASLAVVGMVHGFAPPTFRAYALAILISGVSWGLVSWAVAQAAFEVERDISEAKVGGEAKASDPIER